MLWTRSLQFAGVMGLTEGGTYRLSDYLHKIHTAGTAILTTELEILTMFGSDHRGVDINWCSSFQSVLDGRLNQIWH